VDRKVLAVVALCVGALALCHGLIFAREGPAFPVDDAYITLHNALVLRAGNDPVYVGTPALTGATSAAHCLLVSALSLLAKPAWALWLAAWVAALAYALGVVALGAAFRQPRWLTLTLVALALVLGRVPHQLLNGLETGLAMAGITWALALASRDTPRAHFALALVVGVLPFLRPELAALSLFLIGFDVHRTLAGTPRSADGARHLALRFGLSVAAAAPFLAIYFVTTGSFVPQTIFAKKAFFAEGCLPPAVKLEWMWTSLSSFATDQGLFVQALLMLVLSGLGRVGLLFVVTLLAAYYRDFPGALGHYEHRYLYVVVPFLLLGVSIALADARRWTRWFGAFLLVAGVEQSLVAAPGQWRNHRAGVAFTEHELGGVATWLRENVPADGKILLHDAGYVSFTVDRRAVDLVGLKTPMSHAEHRSRTLPSCGKQRGEAVHQVALAQQPTHLVVLRRWDEIYELTKSLTRFGWKLHRVRDQKEGYDVYRLSR